MDKAYNQISFRISKLITHHYSTSFSLAVSLLKPETRNAIYAIYGFVRLADEIVDSFQGYDQSILLEKFESDYYHAYKYGISTNPILHSFQDVVKEYQIPDELIKAFLKSMKMDLHKKEYSSHREMNEYVNGSANVVGLMCLMVFVNGDINAYNQLKEPAQKLGSAFQKVNFLRDLKCDTEILNRQYFPDIVADSFNEKTKAKIIDDIENDFAVAYRGIVLLPPNARLAVMIAYSYYWQLLRKIRHAGVEEIKNSRIRISNLRKIVLLTKAMTLYKLKLI
jgi:15-cis-phytoene synthase